MYPELWKISRVIPIYKSGSRDNIRNYRPVSILSKLSLVFERLLFEKLFIIIRGQISVLQFGFMARRSTQLQLLQYVDELYHSLDQGKTINAMYLDFSKAFDKVPHNLLIMKLRNFGVGGGLLRLVSSYLKGRKQFVAISCANSSSIPVLSGVPQGSILSPLLFLTFINDLPSVCVHSFIMMFADDVKLFTNDLSSLELDCRHIFEWGRKNFMVFNIEKTIFFTSKIHTSIKFLSNDIPGTTKVKDLGVNISADLNWTYHIRSRIKAANINLLKLMRNIPRMTNSVVKLSLYRSYILSIVMYCSSVWSPGVMDLSCLEKLQSRATKWIMGRNSDYRSRLISLRILPVSLLLQLNDLVLFNKMLTGAYDI
ncbi:MAG: reverse transcriptase domain-containing protein, partial [Bacteroidota bacterium]